MSNEYYLSSAVVHLKNLAERPIGLMISSIGTLGAGTLSFFDWIAGSAGAITVLCTIGGLITTAVMNIRRDMREERETKARMTRDQIEHEARLKKIYKHD